MHCWDYFNLTHINTFDTKFSRFPSSSRQHYNLFTNETLLPLATSYKSLKFYSVSKLTLRYFYIVTLRWKGSSWYCKYGIWCWSKTYRNWWSSEEVSTPCFDGELKHENLVSNKLRMVNVQMKRMEKSESRYLFFLSFFFFYGGNINCITLFDT